MSAIVIAFCDMSLNWTDLAFCLNPGLELFLYVFLQQLILISLFNDTLLGCNFHELRFITTPLGRWKRYWEFGLFLFKRFLLQSC